MQFFQYGNEGYKSILDPRTKLLMLAVINVVIIHLVAGEMKLENLMDRSIFALSGGEKQKIACASVAVAEPEISGTCYRWRNYSNHCGIGAGRYWSSPTIPSWCGRLPTM